MWNKAFKDDAQGRALEAGSIPDIPLRAVLRFCMIRAFC